MDKKRQGKHADIPSGVFSISWLVLPPGFSNSNRVPKLTMKFHSYFDDSALHNPTTHNNHVKRNNLNFLVPNYNK